MKKLTQEEFIKKAQKVHGDKYDYSKVDYKTNKDKVCIICPEHGEYIQRPDMHIYGQGCPRCKTDKLSSNKETFVEKARKIHGENKYDYSKVEYINAKTKVCIVCPIHGEFWQTPNVHLGGKGCPKCKCEGRKRVVFGFGINDMLNVRGEKFYDAWYQMLKRCYDSKFHAINPTYSDCTVCDEWHYLSNFKKWFDEHYVEGWQLDKDILVKGNKVYSPQTCCFVPPYINTLLINPKKNRGGCPLGVIEIPNKTYIAMCRADKKHNYLGSFDTPEEAFQAYKVAKEAYIKEVAEKWKDKLKPCVYEALMNYKIEITD